ncbi:hypothetical protein GA0115253_1075328 [Streptomyces sp. Termitarium-T10T-6]|nr:hypothetical protein GA0115253_1075328 [Streptomyces sp. Termitarium-T10T-6]
MISSLNGLESRRFCLSSFVFQAPFRMPARVIGYLVGKNDQNSPRPLGMARTVSPVYSGTAHEMSIVARSCISPAPARARGVGRWAWVNTFQVAWDSGLPVRASWIVCRTPSCSTVISRRICGMGRRSSRTTVPTWWENNWKRAGNSRCASWLPATAWMSCPSRSAAPGSRGRRTTVVAQPSSSSRTGSAERSFAASIGRAMRRTGASKPASNASPPAFRISSCDQVRSNPNAPEVLKN